MLAAIHITANATPTFAICPVTRAVFCSEALKRVISPTPSSTSTEVSRKLSM